MPKLEQNDPQMRILFYLTDDDVVLLGYFHFLNHVNRSDAWITVRPAHFIIDWIKNS